MKLTVLGKYGPYAPPGGATSGYLLEAGETKILIDCGSGVLSRLQWFTGISNLSAVILSHLHSDHIADMYLLAYALNLLHVRGVEVPIPLNIFLPSEPGPDYKKLASIDVFNVNEMMDSSRIQIGPVEISFYHTMHPVKCFAMDISCEGKKLFYTGDTGSYQNILHAAQGADLLLCDAGLLARDKTTNQAPHLTAVEVGEFAQAAEAKRLLCTHFWPGYTDDQVVFEAKKSYQNAEACEELKTYTV